MFKRVRVRGASMAPTLQDGQRLLACTVTYRVKSPRRGDLALVQHPRENFRVVKRIAALPGDEFQGRRLGPDEYAVLGDNPAATTDSATWGPVPKKALRARVWFAYGPWRWLGRRR